MERHITVVGVLHIAYNVVGILIGLTLFTFLTGIGIFTGDDVALTVLTLVATFLAGLFLIGSIPGVIGGIFLLQRKEWARILVIIVSFFDLLHVPLGTLLGAYSLWVLLNADVVAVFQGKAPGVTTVPGPPAPAPPSPTPRTPTPPPSA
jgi:hypothetical protein